VRSGSTRFWAWTVSITVHLIVLVFFGVAKFSQAKAQDRQQPMATAKINRIKKLIETSGVIGKPKIKPPNSNFTSKTAETLSTDQIFDIPMLSSADIADFTSPSVSTGPLSPGDCILPHRVEFFGAWTDERRLCYVVDCSGSMKGLFGRVRKELKTSIESLQPDQYFSIIFFSGGKIFEFGNGSLIRATRKAMLVACDFIDSVRPAGRTNALTALERAVRIGDDNLYGPSVIYFLTDGFELTAEDTQRFPQKVTSLLNRFAPSAKINTIGFWPTSDDREMLEAIARQSGGEFVFITDAK
jgi:hypothetical protein